MKERVRQFIDVGGTRIAYRAFGDGKPFILLQRLRGGTDDWDPGFRNPKYRRVIAFDNAGVGESAGSVPPRLGGSGGCRNRALSVRNPLRPGSRARSARAL